MNRCRQVALDQVWTWAPKAAALIRRLLQLCLYTSITLIFPRAMHHTGRYQENHNERTYTITKCTRKTNVYRIELWTKQPQGLDAEGDKRVDDMYSNHKVSLS